MRKLVIPAILMALSACQSSTQSPSQPQPTLDVPAGAQSVTIAAAPMAVHAALVASAAEKGTPIVQDQPNMVVMERQMTGENPALDAEFGPSDNGQRVVRGSGCALQGAPARPSPSRTWR
ncbi:hypothetical protein [uncultured Roseibium sp.]|uniref:hypothetical protein n=1 Tax=uncultured Roseibium sp. TaxID=1936171 RepID=UPI003216DFE0